MHFHCISFHQLFPNSSLYTHTHNPKNISQLCSTWVIVKQSSSTIYQILQYPLQQGKESRLPKNMLLITDNTKFCLARSKEMDAKDSAGCWSWLIQKENSQKHIAKESRDKRGNMAYEKIWKMWEEINRVWGKIGLLLFQQESRGDNTRQVRTRQTQSKMGHKVWCIT